MTDIEKKAWDYAKKAHEGVFRKFTHIPYFEGHVIKVYEILKKYDKDPKLGAASLLHDTLEDDPNTTYEKLSNLFGEEITNLVVELTSDNSKIKEMGKGPYLLQKMQNMSVGALEIKLADRRHNIEDCLNASDSFKFKYYHETRFIINNLINSRELNEIHLLLIGEINGILGLLQSENKYESMVLSFDKFSKQNK